MASLLGACASEPEAVYAPDFTLPTVNGESVTLSDLRGKPVMLTFWAIGCSACLRQMPYVQAFYDNYSTEAVVVLTIHGGGTPALVRNFLTSQGFTLPVLLDQRGTVFKGYEVEYIPITFFIDSDGMRRAHTIRPFKSTTEIQVTLEEVFPSFTSAAKPDTTPPLISQIDVSDITDSSATVSWATDEPATSQVEYGTTDAHGSTTPLAQELVTSRSITLTGLEPDTTYHYSLRSQDASGNEATSAADHDFATLTPIQVGPEVGMRAPDFTLQTIDGESVTLGDFRGKTVMVNVWVTQCEGCVDELPHFQAVFDKRSREELAVLAINTTEDPAIVKEFVNSQGFTFPVLVDPQGQIAESYGRFGAPTTFFIDGEGIVRAIEHGAFLSPEEIEKLLDAL